MMPAAIGLPAEELELTFAVLRFIAKHQAPPPTAANHAAVVGTQNSNDPFVIPEAVAEPLEAFRMAATSLPVVAERIKLTRAALSEALRIAYPNDAEELSELFTKGAAAVDPKAGTRPSFMLNNLYAMHSMQEVVPGLFLGSYHPAADKNNLISHNITHVLCCIDVAPRFPAELVYMTLPADDSPTYNISVFFDKTFDFIENAIIKKHSNVLVHCGAGISRAPTIAAAYLIRKMHMRASDAIALLKSKRGVVSPNKGFRQQLQAYQKGLGI